MPLGDSITRGSNGINYPNGSIPGGYRRQLGIRLANAGFSYDFVGNSNDNPAPGMDPDHNGRDGFRTDQSLANLSTWLAVNPDVVLMHLGTNDILQNIPLSTTVTNLGLLIQQITANAPNRKLYVATIIPIVPTQLGQTGIDLNNKAIAYNIQVRNLVQQFAAQGRNVILVDMNAGLTYTNSDPLKNFFQIGDEIHPGQAGYNQMGDFWFNAIQTGGTVPPAVPKTQLLINGGFESDYTGWMRTGNQAIQSAAIYSATEGTKLVAFNGGNQSPDGVLSQTFQTTPGVTYGLTFDAGVLAYNTSQQRLQVAVSGARLILSQVATLTGSGNGSSRWQAQSFSFVADSSSTTLTFRDLSASSNSIDLLLDNVRVSGPAATGTNTAPVAAVDSYSGNQNTALVVPSNGVLANDVDPQSDPLAAILNSTPGNGSVILNANGGFTYTPATSFAGTDSFTYHANDGSLNSNVVTVTIRINAVTSQALSNGSFESDLAGWTSAGSVEIKSSAPYFATDGAKLVNFNGGNQTPSGVLSQSFATIAGQAYTLAFDAGVLSYNTNSQTLQVAVNGTSNLLTKLINITGSGGGTNRWVPQSFTFVADNTSTIMTFRDQSTSTNAIDLLLDNVRVTRVATAISAASQEVPVSAQLVTPPVLLPSLGSLSISGVPGDFKISMTTPGPGTYIAERSSDLITWERFSETNTDEPGLIQFQDSDASSTPKDRMFYRIGLQPEVVAD